MGNFWIRQEIIDNAPDVAQAVVDTFVEGILWTRYNPKEAIVVDQQGHPLHRFFERRSIELTIYSWK